MIARKLWLCPGMSRGEIARSLDLYRSTVTNIMNSLIENNLVLEENEGEATPQGGRKPICLALNPRFGCVMGLEIQSDWCRAVVIDLFGTILFSAEYPFPGGDFSSVDFPCAVDSLVQAVMPALGNIGMPLLGICLGVPGIVDMIRGVIVRSDPFTIRDCAIAHLISRKYRVPVIVVNDANCLAWYQLAKNRGEDMKDFFSVNAECRSHGSLRRMSVGIGIATGGRVYSGFSNGAGEFASHSWRSGESGQCGLDPEVMDRVETDPVAFGDWVIDLFTSLVPVASALDPSAIFAHGILSRRADEVSAILDRRMPQFRAFLERFSCDLSFGDRHSFAVAEGAAHTFFQRLFYTPQGSDAEGLSLMDWDDVFSLSGRPGTG